MGKIIGSYLISSPDANRFNTNLQEAITRVQAADLEAEIQYSVASGSLTVFSALVIAREPEISKPVLF